MQIRTIPFELPFLPALAKHIAKKHSPVSPDFSSILVVFPSERNKVYFREYLLQEAGTEGIIPPNLFTIEQLYDYIFEKMGGANSELAEEIERNVFLKQAVEQIKFKNFEQLSFIKFISIGRKLLGIFDEVTSWNLTLKDIEDVKEKLHFPPQYIDEELPILKKIHERYKKILNNKGSIDTISAHLSIAKNFKTEYLKDFEFIYIAGCLALTLTDVLLIKKILTNLQSELVIHCDKEKLTDNSLDNIFYHHNKILKMLGADTQDIRTLCPENSTDNPRTAVYIQKCKDALDEVYFIINAVSELSARYPLHRIGVMLPDESFYLPLKDALEKLNIPYNLSMGIPFKHTPLYSFLKDAYNFMDSDFSSRRFLTLLKNPIIKGITQNGISFKECVYKVDKKIRNENLSRIERGAKFPENKIIIDFVFGIIDTMGENCSFGAYVKNIRDIVGKLVELNDGFYRKTSAVLNDIMAQLVKIENSKVPDEFCPKGKDKLRFLINILEGMSFPVSGNFLNGVQVIGVLEARNIDFDCIIIPSCNEGIFPQKSEKDLFLPANLRKELGLPFYKERDALYCYYFHQLITGKKEAYLSYRSEEKTELNLRNRWIERLIEGGQKNFIVTEKNAKDSAGTVGNLFLNETNTFITGKRKKNFLGAGKNVGILATLKTFTFSPSALKMYKQCAYKFYLSYILNLKQPKAVKEEYDASVWGTILHKTLARLYTEIYPQGYSEDIKKQVIKNLTKISEEEFKKAYSYPKGALYFDWEQNRKRFIRIIDKEIEHFKEGFKPVKMEKELAPYIININDKLKIKIGGRPDRIDARPSTDAAAGRPSTDAAAGRNEKYYIIDYKLSRKPSAKTYRIPATKDLAGRGEDFTEFQLPLYGLSFTKGNIEKIGGLIYYHLDESLKDFVALDILKEEGGNYIREFTESILLPTLKDIFDEKTSFRLTENLDICQKCIFIDHCRRRV